MPDETNVPEADTAQASARVSSAKAALRSQMKGVLAGITDGDRRAAHEAMVSALMSWIAARLTGGVVALFASLPDEVDMRALDHALYAQGVPRAFPICREGILHFVRIAPGQRLDDMVPGFFGIRTPAWPGTGEQTQLVPMSTLDAIVVPGLALDMTGGRLGRGKGYYDRALTEIGLDRAVGVGFDCQVVEYVPCAAHDIRLQWLWTPRRGVVRTLRAATGSASEAP